VPPYKVKNKVGGRDQEFLNQIISYQPNREFGFKTGDSGMSYTAFRTFEEQNGRTVITEKVTGEFSGLQKLVGPLVMGFIQRSHHNSLLRLKEILENGRN
jgi:hypothetical protein